MKKIRESGQAVIPRVERGIVDTHTLNILLALHV